MPQVRARTIGEDRTDSDVIMGAPTRKLSELTLVDTTLKKEILGAGIDEEARCDAAQPAARGDPVQANDLYVRETMRAFLPSACHQQESGGGKAKKESKRMQKLLGSERQPLCWHEDHGSLYEEILTMLGAVACIDLTPGTGVGAVECAKKGLPEWKKVLGDMAEEQNEEEGSEEGSASDEES
ncbi:unnamed protein product [Durusdinium trenchii]|uniref:Uncharacterized protein n=1 Tax=Durusdinium trenchii TaxID=1381693 RepID=A0ABP0M8X1_9DINO